MRQGGWRFAVDTSPPHPHASDPVVIEDPLNVINNVGRSSYNFVAVQRLFSRAHDQLRDELLVDPRSRSPQANPNPTVPGACPEGGGTGEATVSTRGAAGAASSGTTTTTYPADDHAAEGGSSNISSKSEGAADGSSNGGSSNNNDDRSSSTHPAEDGAATGGGPVCPHNPEVPVRVADLKQAADDTGILAVIFGARAPRTSVRRRIRPHPTPTNPTPPPPAHGPAGGTELAQHQALALARHQD